VANHSDPESCGAHREVCVEALTGETGRPAIEPRNDSFGMPTLLSEAEGNTVHGVNRKPCPDPARSETLCMPGSLSYGSSEISSVSSANGLDGTGKVVDHNPVIYVDEKSDTPIVPQKLSNNGDDPAEAMEGRGVIGGNAFETPACRTQSRIKHASMGIEGVRPSQNSRPSYERKRQGVSTQYQTPSVTSVHCSPLKNVETTSRQQGMRRFRCDKL
jgi:RNA-directed DNA polymerase